ncbi:IS200/IS605 family transposase, partial [Candidatus Methylacidiphilum fumarolicum]|uniref:IS200/IS605 family transposase n=3 Tax=Candidatus Methylacidiphilum fumarolicum TaxID=591154 RepID=UPI00106D2204
MADTLQTGKTRWAHYQIAYHFVWIPKYRRRILSGEVDAACKALLAECCRQHGFRLPALETDIDHVHCFVSASPRWSPSTIVGLLKGYTSRGALGNGSRSSRTLGIAGNTYGRKLT